MDGGDLSEDPSTAAWDLSELLDFTTDDPLPIPNPWDHHHQTLPLPDHPNLIATPPPDPDPSAPAPSRVHKRDPMLVCSYYLAGRVVVEGENKRYCQQCGKFHILSNFDEGKRSCRRKLEHHNNRRRKKPAGSRVQVEKELPQDVHPGDDGCGGDAGKDNLCKSSPSDKVVQQIICAKVVHQTRKRRFFILMMGEYLFPLLRLNLSLSPRRVFHLLKLLMKYKCIMGKIIPCILFLPHIVTIGVLSHPCVLPGGYHSSFMIGILQNFPLPRFSF